MVLNNDQKLRFVFHFFVELFWFLISFLYSQAFGDVPLKARILYHFGRMAYLEAQHGQCVNFCHQAQVRTAVREWAELEGMLRVLRMGYGSQYWDYYRGALTLSQVTRTHLIIRHPYLQVRNLQTSFRDFTKWHTKLGFYFEGGKYHLHGFLMGES